MPQLVHDDDPSRAEYWPESHVKHAIAVELWPLDSPYFPFMHLAHEDLPLWAEYWPATHSAQTSDLDAPEIDEYRPVPQSIQIEGLV